MDFLKVHGWLASSYWAKDVSSEKVERAAAGSALVIGAFYEGEQVGYMRVISDGVTFGWLTDVYVDESVRGKGIASLMVEYAMQHPDYQGFRRWCLLTKDAQTLYQKHGFEVIPDPEFWMVHYPNQT